MNHHVTSGCANSLEMKSLCSFFLSVSFITFLFLHPKNDDSSKVFTNTGTHFFPVLVLVRMFRAGMKSGHLLSGFGSGMR